MKTWFMIVSGFVCTGVVLVASPLSDPPSVSLRDRLFLGVLAAGVLALLAVAAKEARR